MLKSQIAHYKSKKTKTKTKLSNKTKKNYSGKVLKS